MKAELKYSVIDVALTQRNGRWSFYAYKSFSTKEQAEKYRKANCPLWRSKVIGD